MINLNLDPKERKAEIFRLIITGFILVILILTYFYVTKGELIKSITSIELCKLENSLIFESLESAKYISKIEEENKNDTLKLKIFKKSVSFIQSSGPYKFVVILGPKVKFVQILDSTFEVEKIEKCIE